MKHAIILGHPDQKSFTHSVAAAYGKAVTGLGHSALVRDLYALKFDPRLQGPEIPRVTGYAPGEDVKAERDLIADVDVFVFVYPLWFNAPPAIVSGYVQRIFSMGFGYSPIHGGGNQPLLAGKRMLSFTSSGAPSEWLKSQGGWTALRTLFDGHLAEVCGFSILDHVHFGSVLSQMPKAHIDAHLAVVASTVDRLFKR